MPGGGFALQLEVIDFDLQLGNAVVEIGLALGKRLDPARFNLALQVDRAELGDLAIEQADLGTHLAVEGAVGGVHHSGGLGNAVLAVVDQPIQIEALTHVAEEIFL